MELKNLIETHLDLARLSKDLDELGHPGRLWSIHQWTRVDMTILWEATKGFRPVTPEDFVPPSVEPLVEVVHHGKNSLALFSHFEKRFCKPKNPEKSGELVGYNSQSTRALTGPGYFVVRPSTDTGEVEIDYTKVPTEKAEAWPPIVPNAQRLGRFVFEGMIDTMRGISSHVTIGRARKGAEWKDAWFVLVREDRGASSGSGPNRRLDA
jgi:hypothetical protein